MSRHRAPGRPSLVRTPLVRSDPLEDLPKGCRWISVRTALHMVLVATNVLLVVAHAWTQLWALWVMLGFVWLGVAGYRALGSIDEPGQLPAPEPGEWAS